MAAGERHPLEAFLLSGLDKVYTAAALHILVNGQAAWQGAYGQLCPEQGQHPTRSDSLFDLASLTKLFTATALMRLLEAGKAELDTPGGAILPAFRGKRTIGASEDPLRGVMLPAEPGEAGQSVALERIRLRDLLMHTSGLAAWRSVYAVGGDKEIVLQPHEVATALRQQRMAAVYAYDFAYPPGARVVYSDLGFMLLGEAVQMLSGLPLAEAIDREVCTPLGLQRTTYNPLRQPWAEGNVAASEVCPWRQRRLLGEVDDQNAASLGGVAGHAGLFSTAQEVARLGQMYLDGGRTACGQVLQTGNVLEMRREQVNLGGLRRGLAWVLQTPQGCSCGSRFSPQSFGHTGFTGTSLWIDPQRNLVVAALTNRVYFGRDAGQITQFRPALHDLIIQCLEEGRL